MGQFLTRQQIRFIRLLEMNAPELDEVVEKELEANPALEAIDREEVSPHQDSQDATPYYLRNINNTSPDDKSYDFSPADNSENLYDYLRSQVSERDIPPEIATIANYIIGNLDSNGYLQRPLAGIIDDLAFNQDIIIPNDRAEKALEVVRSLDPPGIGGENLRQTLLLQLDRLPDSQARRDAMNILNDFFEAYYMRHSHKIISGLKISKERVEDANKLILSLNPKPGAPFGGNTETASGVIIPDFNISREGDDFFISLNNKIPELAIQESFSEAMREVSKNRSRKKKGNEFITSRYNDAKDFIEVLQQRQQTMLTVMTAILHWQQKYFESGDVYTLRPMMLRDLSDATGLDMSVISRSTANKYVDTPWGAIIPLKSLFSDTVTQDNSDNPLKKKTADTADGRNKVDGEDKSGTELTNRKVEALIEELVRNEDKKHPLSDEKIRLELLKKGYDISRRTVAKYRDRKGILIARLRKTL